jgi:hypothetical protein
MLLGELPAYRGRTAVSASLHSRMGALPVPPPPKSNVDQQYGKERAYVILG